MDIVWAPLVCHNSCLVRLVWQPVASRFLALFFVTWMVLRRWCQQSNRTAPLHVGQVAPVLCDMISRCHWDSAPFAKQRCFNALLLSQRVACARNCGRNAILVLCALRRGSLVPKTNCEVIVQESREALMRSCADVVPTPVW